MLSVLLHPDRHAGALFAFYGEDECIMHRDEKVTHPRGRSPNPSNGTECVVLSDVRDSAEFYFGDLDGKEMSPNHSQFSASFFKRVRKKTLEICPNNNFNSTFSLS